MAAVKDTAAAGLSDDQVLAYLKSHPDFLATHPELLETMELQHATGSAVSLIERQVEVLRGRSQRLEDRMTKLLENARDNERRASNVHRLARTLIRAPTLAAAILGLQQCMREDFGIDEAWVGVSPGLLKRSDIEGLQRLEPEGAVGRQFDDFLRTKLIECGPLTAVRAKLLFPKAAEPPQSAAVVPLERDKNLGMLVLASRDPERFQPRQGKVFLEMTAELVAAAVRAKLVS
ncbi:MAG: hypothetical protein JWQ90_1712 [Hydrocarboniphaga sp.]|uniref:DUF484 family protein n=1 Tax=Hydrocarboniphaga sp. TaxID=2033016 RepID=UPI0026335F15|nr:DUF484 family protein [Hydrocarboniphaga sp.]MDB5969262.1 hypothetical protein [Hydrocarboniphaga sp.]